MSQCVNSMLLRKHEDEIEFNEKALENFLSDIEPDLKLIDEALANIRQLHNGYAGFDFSEEIKEAVLELL